MLSQGYTDPTCESGLGNVSADPMRHMFSGTEANNTVVKLRKMSEHNTYLRIRAIAEAGITATVNLGYVSREEGASDAPTFFATGVNLSTANQEVFADAKDVPVKHDVVMTITANNAANANHTVKFWTEFVNTAG